MKSIQPDLYQLVHALTPAEQRTFHHIALRHTSQRPMGYFELYEILRKQDRFDEAAAREATGLKKPHFAVIKRQLYEQLMQALSYHHRQDHDLEKGRRLLQQTRILLEKDLVGQAEKRLRKARKLIEAHQLTALQTECLLLRKAILEKRLNQPAARQTLNALQKDWNSAVTALNLAGEAAIVSLEVALQHLQKIRAQGSQEGHSPIAAMDRPAFREALQAPQWTTQLDARRALSTYHFMNAEPAAAFAQNEALLQLFREAPFLTERYPARYLTVFQNLLIDHFQLQNWAELEEGLQQLRQLPQQKAFKRLQGITPRIEERSTLLEANMLVARKAYARGRQLAEDLLPRLQRQALRLSYPNQQSLLYLLALCQWLDGAADAAQSAINLFLDRYRKKTLEELYHFARLLQLMIHFDLQHFELLPYLLQSFRRSHTGFYPESTGLFLQYLPQLLNAAGPRERLQTRNEWRSAIVHAGLEDRESRFYEYLDLFYWMDNPVH
ncbi:MAG: hypothetical protein NXI25_05375 [bacterium]|nr:hypothetical protein [bacterium]